MQLTQEIQPKIKAPFRWEERFDQSERVLFNSVNLNLLFAFKLPPQSQVSIRLESPGSGDSYATSMAEGQWGWVSIQLVSPASGDPYILNTVPVRSLEAVSEVQ